MFYTGIDLHQDNGFFVTVDDTGSVVKQQRLPNDPGTILDYFHAIGAEHSAVVECTSGWYWLSDLCEDSGIPLILAHAKYLKAISYAKVKTDKVDATTLARLLRLGAIPQAHKISRELRDLRDVMRARLRLVTRRTSVLASIHNLARKFNRPEQQHDPDLPDQLPASYTLQLQGHRRHVQLLNDQILELERFLHPTLVPNDDIQRLLGVPGIGKVSAFTIYLELDGIDRFPSDKDFVSYCRLVPGANNSNRSIRHRSHNKDGNRYLKIAFCDIAVHAIQYYPEIRAFYQRKVRRSNEGIARTIVAKELARIVFHLLKNKTDYRGFKGQPPSRIKSFQWPRLKLRSQPLATPGKPPCLTDAVSIVALIGKPGVVPA
jgi:transposase